MSCVMWLALLGCAGKPPPGVRAQGTVAQEPPGPGPMGRALFGKRLFGAYSARLPPSPAGAGLPQPLLGLHRDGPLTPAAPLPLMGKAGVYVTLSPPGPAAQAF